jgi:hypothetical protein
VSKDIRNDRNWISGNGNKQKLYKQMKQLTKKGNNSTPATEVRTRVVRSAVIVSIEVPVIHTRIIFLRGVGRHTDNTNTVRNTVLSATYFIYSYYGSSALCWASAAFSGS